MDSVEQNKFVLKAEQLATIIEKLTTVPCVIIGGVMVVTVISGVGARYIMKNPMPWTEEVARFCMNWVALLGASIVARHRGHLGLLYFIRKVPLSFQRFTKLLMDILILIFLYLLTVEGFNMAMAAVPQIEPTSGISMAYILACVPLAGLLMILQTGLQMFVDAFQWKTSKSPYVL